MKGQLQAADTSHPIRYGMVQLHGGDTTRADNTGHFTLTAPKGLHRIVLTATDYFDDYVKTTKVIYPAAVSGMTYTLMTMLRKAQSVSRNASQDAVLTMGGEQERDAFGEIHIPRQSVFSDDGSVYTGEVMASLTVIDPRNMTDIINTPSNLAFVDEEGAIQPLKSFGMFNLQLTDLAGKSLQVQGDIELMLDLDILGYNVQDLSDNLPKVWVLDTATGQWVKVADMKKDQRSSFRFKREASTLVVRGVRVPFSGEWVSYASAYDRHALCFSRIQLYETNKFELQIHNKNCPKLGLCANPYVIVWDGTNKTYHGYNHNFGVEYGYCVSHPCDVDFESGYHGYVFVEYEGQRTVAVNDDAGTGIKDQALKRRINYESVGDAISVHFSYRDQKSEKGPFYLMDAAGTYDSCRFVDDENNHFRFYVWENTKCIQTEVTKHCGGSNPNSYDWCTKDNDNRYIVIYIKIKTNSSRNVLFQAQSEVGNSHKGSQAKKGETYGERTGCAKDNEPVCLEVKPSGKVFVDSGKEVEFDETQLVVQTVKDQGRGTCSGYIINNLLAKTINESTEFVQSHKFKMNFTEGYMKSGISYKEGVYFLRGDKDEDLENVKERALASCKAGCIPGQCQQSDPTNDRGSALEFFCR